MGLDSTKIVLTEVGQEWFTSAYPPGIIYEYVVTEPFILKSMGAEAADIICPMGIPYRIPLWIEGNITFQAVPKPVKGE